MIQSSADGCMGNVWEYILLKWETNKSFLFFLCFDRIWTPMYSVRMTHQVNKCQAFLIFTAVAN